MDRASLQVEKSYSHKAAQICQVINEIKQLTNVIGDGWAVGVHPLQMLFVHFAHTYKRCLKLKPTLNMFSGFWDINGLRVQLYCCKLKWVECKCVSLTYT